ncbi:hypothetical protein [Sphingomonas sp. LT1P40]|uniref:hypothetical protein n=1 Tax=Alteristakelama amylovorans TaxID=3096166 RepID=UPI002FCC8C88
MAKDKKSKSAKSDKKNDGIKIPKEVRKQVEKFVELAKHPMVSDIVAAGLVALASSMRKGDAKADVAPKPSDAAGNLSKSATILATALAAKAAQTVSSRLFDSPAPPPAPSTPAAAPKPAARKPAARKPAATKSAAAKPAATKLAAAAKPKAPAKAAVVKAPAVKAAAKPKAPVKPRATTRKPAARKPAAKPVS